MDPNQSASIVNLDEEAEAFVTKKQKKQSNNKSRNSTTNNNNKQTTINTTEVKTKNPNNATATTSSANGTVTTTTKPNAPRCPRLRIFKNDIRRSYTFMVANVLNSVDFNFIRGFFKRFAVPQISFVMSHDPCGAYDTLYNPNFYCNLAGSEAIGCYLGVLTYSTPDYIFSVKDTQIKVRSDCPGSVVTCHYTGTGTFQYECSLEAIATDLLQAFAQFSTNTQQQQQQALPSDANSNEEMEIVQDNVQSSTSQKKRKLPPTTSTTSPTNTTTNTTSTATNTINIPVDSSQPINYATANIFHQPTKMTANIDGKTLTTTTTLSEAEMSCFMNYVSRIERLTSKTDRTTLDDATSFLKPVRIPYTYTVHGQMTMMIDEEKRIQSIDFHRQECFYSFASPSVTTMLDCNSNSNSNIMEV